MTRNGDAGAAYICVVRDAVRRVKGAPRFPYANYQGDIRPAKITVENNVIDWEDELARARAFAFARREMDNISLGRPLRRTIK